MAHRAFISYSHQSDAVLAPAIQSALHKFAKPWYRMRALSVFLDKTSLAASAALGPSIEKALGEAEWFLLLASPLSARSHWVQQEVGWWLKNRPVERMLILLSDGDLVWDLRTRDFDWSRTTAIANEFSGRFADEPLYVDFRWVRTEEHGLSLRHTKFRSAILDLVAPLHGREKDELDGDDVRQHRRTRIVSAVAVALILTGAVVAGWQAYVATQARIAAMRQRDLALGALLRSEAERLESLEQFDPALLLALESSRYSQTADIYETVYRVVANRAQPVYYSPQPVEFSVISPNGRYVAVVDVSGVSLVPLTPASDPIAIPEPRVMRARFSTDSTLLAVVDEAGVVKVFDVPQGTLRSTRIEPLDSGAVPRLPNLSEDGTLMATAATRTVRIIETFTGRVVFEQTHTEEVVAAFPAGPALAAVVTASGQMGVLSTDGFVRMRVERRSALRHITDSANTDLLVFKFQDPAEDIVLWNSRSGEEYGGVPPQARSAAVSPRGDRLALGFEDGTVLIRTLSTGRETARFKFNYFVSGLKFSPDGRRLLVLSSDTSGLATVHRLDTTGWLQIGSARVVPANARLGSNSEIVIDATGAMVSAGRSVLAFQDGVRQGWRTPPPELAHLTLSGNWERVAGVVSKGSVLVADVQSGDTVSTFADCENFGPPALNVDAGRLAVRCHSAKELRLYDVDGTRLIGTLDDTNETPLAFTPAGDQVISGSQVIDVPSLQRTSVIYPGVYRALAFAPDGQRALLASSGFGPNALYESIKSPEDNPPSRRQIETGIVDAVAYSDDGVYAAAAFRGDSNLRIYRRSNWQRMLLHLKEEGSYLSVVTKIVFSHKGDLLACVAETLRDQSFRTFVTLRVFDTATGIERLRVPLGQSPLALRFTQDNQTVQVLGGQPFLEQQDFPLRVQDWIESGCNRVTQNLTPEQWSRYLPGVEYRRTCDVLNPAAEGLKVE